MSRRPLGAELRAAEAARPIARKHRVRLDFDDSRTIDDVADAEDPSVNDRELPRLGPEDRTDGERGRTDGLATFDRLDGFDGFRFACDD